MVSKSDKKLLLIAGGAAIIGYLLLRKTEAAITGVTEPIGAFFGGIPAGLAAIPAGIEAGATDLAAGVQAGAAALSGGAINLVGAGITGLEQGAAGALIEGFQEVTKPFPQPLRTYKPVPEVRTQLTEATVEVPGVPFPVSPQRVAYQEEIGVPIITPEQLLVQQGKPSPAPELWKAGEISTKELMTSLAATKAATQAQQQPAPEPSYKIFDVSKPLFGLFGG